MTFQVNIIFLSDESISLSMCGRVHDSVCTGVYFHGAGVVGQVYDCRG